MRRVDAILRWAAGLIALPFAVLFVLFLLVRDLLERWHHGKH